MSSKTPSDTSQGMTRRRFIQRSALGAMAASALSSKRVLGANERVPIALIGCGGRGSYVCRNMIGHGVEVRWLCDLHEGRLSQTQEFIAEGQDGRKPKTTTSIREVLNATDVEAVIVATPDHWHSPAAILGLQANKHVYVEKPHAHNVWESTKMIEAAAKYGRVLQVGTQNRSAEYNKAAREYVKAGNLGRIPLVKTYGLEPGGAFMLGRPGKAPEGFDWDAWLGAAPERPYHQAIFGGGWHHFWDFSGGDLVDDGVHQMDLTMMALGDPGLPKSVSCAGGTLAYPDSDSETPDVQAITYEFDDFVMTFELTNYPQYMEKTTTTIRRKDLFPNWSQNATRIELYGTRKMMTIGRHGGGWQVTGPGLEVVDQMYGRFPDDEHQENFVQSVKGQQTPNAHIGVAHNACVMCHLGNIAHRVGNLKLQFDPNTQRFTDNDEANALLKRTYREKYAIPEVV